MRLVVAAATIALAACAAPAPDPEPVGNDNAAQLLELRRDSSIRALRYSNGLSEPATMVIRDANQWRMTWAAITSNHSPMPVPEVDFSRDMVVLVALGTRSTGGYTAAIERIQRTAEGISVDYLAQSPGDRCGTTAALTQPMDFVFIARVEGPATFTRHDQTFDC